MLKVTRTKVQGEHDGAPAMNTEMPFPAQVAYCYISLRIMVPLALVLFKNARWGSEDLLPDGQR